MHSSTRMNTEPMIPRQYGAKEEISTIHCCAAERNDSTTASDYKQQNEWSEIQDAKICSTQEGIEHAQQYLNGK